TSAMTSRANGSGPGATSAPHRAVTITSAAMLGFVSSTRAPSVARRPTTAVELALGTLHGFLQHRERLVDDRLGGGVRVANVSRCPERLPGDGGDAARVELPEAHVVGARELFSLVVDAVETRNVWERIERAARHVATDARYGVQAVDHAFAALCEHRDHLFDLVARAEQCRRCRSLGNGRRIRRRLTLNLVDRFRQLGRCDGPAD